MSVTTANIAEEEESNATSCGYCKNRRFAGRYRIYHQGDKNLRSKNNVISSIVFPRGVRRLLVTANVVPSSSVLVTLMMEALRSSETSVHNKSYTA
jgi:hypothetical protein